jgi:hypothetical protein
MQDSEVKPPPGGRVVSTMLHPAAWGTVAGTEVGVADGADVDGTVVDGAVLALADRSAPADDCRLRWSEVGTADGDEEQPLAVTMRSAAESAAASRLGSTCPLTRARLGRRIGSGSDGTARDHPDRGHPRDRPAQAGPLPAIQGRTSRGRKTMPVAGLG